MSQSVIRRKDKEMSRDEVEFVLARSTLGHFATISLDGTPYVVPNLFVYAEGKIFTHTARAQGHFRRNIEHQPKICFETAEMGQVFPYGEFECDTTVSYASVIGFGTIRLQEGDAEKALFFDRFLAKYADPAWERPKGFYPRLGEVVVYCLELDQLTGKKGPLPAVSQQWPAQNLTKSPGAVPPRKG